MYIHDNVSLVVGDMNLWWTTEKMLKQLISIHYYITNTTAMNGSSVNTVVKCREVSTRKEITFELCLPTCAYLPTYLSVCTHTHVSKKLPKNWTFYQQPVTVSCNIRIGSLVVYSSIFLCSFLYVHRHNNIYTHDIASLFRKIVWNCKLIIFLVCLIVSY